jgi:Ca2+/Na+ antiporter
MAVGDLQAITRWSPAMLLGGVVALFVCARALAALWTREPSDAGGRSLAFFAPIAAVSLVAMLLGRPEVAVAVVFGTSVGAVTTVIGFVALSGQIQGGPARWRRVWPFLLAAALLVFVTGFKGSFDWRDALAMLTEGLLLLSLWRDPTPASAGAGATHASVLEEITDGDMVVSRPGSFPLNYATPAESPDGRTRARRLMTGLELVLVGVLLWLGAWAVTHGTVGTGRVLRGMSTSAIAGSVVSLGLVLPMMYGSWRVAAGGRGWSPVTTQVGVVLLNLCLLLPVLILIPYLAARAPQVARWAGDAMLWHEGLPRLLIFPSPMWRVDNVVLLVVGVFLLPVAFAKWSIGREEGMVLVAGYFFYLTATIASGLEPGLGR